MNIPNSDITNKIGIPFESLIIENSLKIGVWELKIIYGISKYLIPLRSFVWLAGNKSES